jgi:hypothetical protein
MHTGTSLVVLRLTCIMEKISKEVASALVPGCKCAQWIGGIAPQILNLGPRWTRMVFFTRQQISLGKTGPSKNRRDFHDHSRRSRKDRITNKFAKKSN